MRKQSNSAQLAAIENAATIVGQGNGPLLTGCNAPVNPILAGCGAPAKPVLAGCVPAPAKPLLTGCIDGAPPQL